MCEEISCLYVTRQTSEQTQVVTGSALRIAGTGNPRIIDAATHQLRHNTVTVDIATRMRPRTSENGNTPATSQYRNGGHRDTYVARTSENGYRNHGREQSGGDRDHRHSSFHSRDIDFENSSRGYDYNESRDYRSPHFSRYNRYRN
ncbi:hypothetical protein DPMN_059028 [Dreissena polymorpha]|uniref:Uncharacterized protein n=1 Tax=Dreissena polymorpha TaxID=45954 RepID=A0A9D4C2T8_DREPO|nr:hypothetical protein DPMN_059028 [Dreissena polymorpha]